MAKDSTRQPFMEHVWELRSRLTWSVAALLLGTAVGYLLRDQLLELLVAPLGQTIYYTSPGGGFSLMIQLCLGFGVIASVPVLIFHLIRFIAPILPAYSTRFLVVVLLSSCVLVAFGVAFAYYVSLPAALYFLNEFSNDQVQALISTDTYFSFVTLYLAGFAVLFQLPLLLLIINRMKPLNPQTLLAKTRWVVLGSFVIAALITPTPDPFNQTIMAGPVILLYLGSIVPIKVINSHRDDPPSSMSGVRGTDDQVRVGTIIRPDPTLVMLMGHQKRAVGTREGYLCHWSGKDNQTSVGFVTFYYAGQHRFVRGKLTVERI